MDKSTSGGILAGVSFAGIIGLLTSMVSALFKKYIDSGEMGLEFVIGFTITLAVLGVIAVLALRLIDSEKK